MIHDLEMIRDEVSSLRKNKKLREDSAKLYIGTRVATTAAYDSCISFFGKILDFVIENQEKIKKINKIFS